MSDQAITDNSLWKKDMKLYSYWRSSCSYRVRIALALKNLKYSYIPINLLKSEQLSDDYINPLKQVPTLVVKCSESDKEIQITQSLAIIQFIEENHEKLGSSEITPLKHSFRATQQTEIVNAGIQPVQNFAVLKKIISLGGDKMEHGRETIEKGFDALEKLICEFGGKYSVGDELSIADICLVPQVYNARRFKVDESRVEKISVRTRRGQITTDMAITDLRQPF